MRVDGLRRGLELMVQGGVRARCACLVPFPRRAHLSPFPGLVGSLVPAFSLSFALYRALSLALASRKLKFGAYGSRVDGVGGRLREARLSRAIPEAGPRRSCLGFNLNPYLNPTPYPPETIPGLSASLACPEGSLYLAIREASLTA